MLNSFAMRILHLGHIPDQPDQALRPQRSITATSSYSLVQGAGPKKDAAELASNRHPFTTAPDLHSAIPVTKHPSAPGQKSSKSIPEMRESFWGALPRCAPACEQPPASPLGWRAPTVVRNGCAPGYQSIGTLWGRDKSPELAGATVPVRARIQGDFCRTVVRIQILASSLELNPTPSITRGDKPPKLARATVPVRARI